MVGGISSLINLSDLLLLVYRNCNKSMCNNFVSCNFTKFIDVFYEFSDNIFRIFYIQNHVICKQWWFYFFSNWIPPAFFFPFLITMAKHSMNKSGESWHLCFVPDLKRNAFSFSFSMRLVVGFSYMTFIMLRYSCLGNPMDRGVWWVRVHRVTNSWTQLKWPSIHACMFSLCPHFGEFSS